MTDIDDGLIFLCHAKEDVAIIEEVYRGLKESGLRPWMDKPPEPYHREGILPGANWHLELRRRISKASVFLAFFSESSISKRGYVQREFRMALDIRATCPEDSNYFVPVLLEPGIKIPEIRIDGVSVNDFQYFPYYEEGVTGLVAALRGQWGIEPSRTQESRLRDERKELYKRYLAAVARVQSKSIEFKTYYKSDNPSIRLLSGPAWKTAQDTYQDLVRINEEIKMVGSEEIQIVARDILAVALIHTLPIDDPKGVKIRGQAENAMRRYEDELKPRFLEIARRDCT